MAPNTDGPKYNTAQELWITIPGRYSMHARNTCIHTSTGLYSHLKFAYRHALPSERFGQRTNHYPLPTPANKLSHCAISQ